MPEMPGPNATFALLPAALAAVALHASEPGEGLARFGSPELRAHDARAAILREELARLPPAPEVQGGVHVGWHSNFAGGPGARDGAHSIMLDLGARETFDSVVLVPVHVAYGTHPGPGYGFPVR